MTRLFLAAGVAALAIAVPLAAKPGGGHGGGGDHGNGGASAVQQDGGDHNRGGGGGGQPSFDLGGGGGGRGHGDRQDAFGGGGGRGHDGDFAPQMRIQRQQGHGFERQQARNFDPQRGHGSERQQARNFDRQREHEFERHQTRNFERQGGHGFEHQQARDFERQQFRGNHDQQSRAQAFANQHFNGDHFNGRGAFKINGRDARFADRNIAQQNWNESHFAALNYGDEFRIRPMTQVEQFIGAPVGQVAGFAALGRLPSAMRYLYPDTSDYYYRYGDGYLYQVDRGTNLIDTLLPLLGGGYLPGQYLPASYMNSYVPDYYGLDSFYPDYGDTCNRYYSGVIYQADCNDGYVESVIPMYAGGYGVGQLLPSAYNYYNVPTQYRDLYYDTPDYGYWYSPGAIYQYDQQSNAITSVAALLSPGFAVGQPLPDGYDAYNVPDNYRATYYDTADAWYRYNNGYIYQVDPVTQLVTSVVASLLT